MFHILRFFKVNWTKSTSTKVIILFYLHCPFANYDLNAVSHDQPDNLIKACCVSIDSNSLLQILISLFRLFNSAKNISVQTSQNSSVDFSDLLQAVVTHLLSSVSNKIDIDCFNAMMQPCLHCYDSATWTCVAILQLFISRNQVESFIENSW